MNVHYTGRQAELSGPQKKKLETRFQKLQKILGPWHEPEAHVIVSLQRGRYAAEVTLQYRHQTLVVERSGPDLFNVVHEALEKIEQQLIRNKDRWRERKRRAKEPPESAGEEIATSAGGKQQPIPAPRIFRANGPSGKPLTVEEALIEMEQSDRDYVVYRDAVKGGVSVLFRRRDGHFALVEA